MMARTYEKRTVTIDHDAMNRRKAETAEKYGVTASEVRCHKCAYWGYNRGNVMTDYCRSRCSFKKQMTDSCQWCTGWKPKD